MSQHNLTRDEARTRASLVAVETVDVEVDLRGADDDASFPVRTRIRFTSRRPGEGTFLDFTAPAVREVVLNGESLDPAELFDGFRLRLPTTAAENDLLVVGDAAYMNTGEGMHRFVDPVDRAVYLYTNYEPFDAHRVFPMFDQPDLKAEYEFSVIAPRTWKVLSNYPEASRSPVSRERGSQADAADRWTFERTPRISAYITAIAAGPYVGVTGALRSVSGPVPAGVWCRRSLLEFLDAAEILQITQQGFDHYEKTFEQPFPFAKYDQIFVPEFNAGAMENAGLVTYLEEYVFRSKVTDASYERRALTILHELAHMWFGNLVTMRWWDDLWLNESFAEFQSLSAQAVATKWPNAWTTFCNVEKTWALRADQLPSTHPVGADMVDIDAVGLNFDGITYAKGSSVLRQLVAWVGQEAFDRGIANYFRRHAWGNTELADLLAELADASGRDLSGWTDQWLTTAGVSTLRAEVEVDDAGRYSRVVIHQEPPGVDRPGDAVLRDHRLTVGMYDRTRFGLVLRSRVEIDVTGAVTEVPALVGHVQPDLLLLNDADLTYAKLRLDERSRDTLSRSIGEINDPLARGLCWGAVWDMTRDGEMPTGEFLRIVLAGIGRETEVGVLQTVLRQARSAVDQFGIPELRDRRSAALTEAVRRHALAAEPGSDHQLAFVRAWLSGAVAPDGAAGMKALLDGTGVPPGLKVDPDLRWGLIVRLASIGEIGDAEIAAELARDRTAAGERHAAAARAARPDPAAKAAAWFALVDDGGVPNAVQSAMIAGFHQPEQVDLLRPYVARYVDVAPRLFAERSFSTAERLVPGLFPLLVIEDATIAAIDGLLAGEVDGALRRMLEEQRDGMVRALRNRAVDAVAVRRTAP